MSGIYIPGMEMPGRCQACFANEYQVCIFVDKNAAIYGKLTDCPLIPVPKHGRLIDADALRHWILTEMASLDTEEDREFVADRLANELPTIIPAEEGET